MVTGPMRGGRAGRANTVRGIGLQQRLPLMLRVLQKATTMPAAFAALLTLAAAPAPAAAQRASFGGSVVGMITHASPAVTARTLTEAYLTQPMLALHAHDRSRTVALHGMLNFENWTLQRGELNAGIWGEGYVDRRHPHTVLHEAVLVMTPRAAARRVSLAGGRGFVPFGTDDPMVRPFVKYPANHHHAQVLERWIGVAAARAGGVIFEAALFNGDEPAGPTDLGQLRRFGDSWSARLSWQAGDWELQASRADLDSPEIPGGGGLDQRKLSASARWAGPVFARMEGYALVEWARTRELSSGAAGYAFASGLVEAAVGGAGWLAAVRVERTQRPEEERGFDPFRTPRPHVGPRLGVTQWTIASVHLRHRAGGPLAAEPFAEASWHRVREIGNGVFEPAAHYGRANVWNVSAGVRVNAGMRHERVGRYGVSVTARDERMREHPAGH
jgi:hypothetical protein